VGFQGDGMKRPQWAEDRHISLPLQKVPNKSMNLVVSVRVLVNPQSTNRDLGRRINLYLRMTTMQKEQVPKIFSQIVFSW